MSKKKIASIVLVTILICAVIGISIWLIVVRVQSKNYNLIKLDTSSMPNPVDKSDEGFVQLSDVNMHYVQYGTSGSPMIFIHGNGGSTESLKEAATYLGNEHVVYCIDSRCQGQSSDPGVITYDLMAKDVYEFCSAKGIVKPYIMGHSDGGMVAIAVASNYPDLPKAIISCGSNSHPSKFKPYFTIGVKINNLFKPDKLNDLMLTLPDFNEEFLGKITCPTYVVCGEFDIMPLSDSVYIYESISDSKIAVVKWATHSAYISNNGKKAYVLARDYIKEIESR